jgi:glutaredoxin-related protein
VKGDLIGGLDIIKELSKDGDLAGNLGVNVKILK